MTPPRTPLLPCGLGVRNLEAGKRARGKRREHEDSVSEQTERAEDNIRKRRTVSSCAQTTTQRWRSEPQRQPDQQRHETIDHSSDKHSVHTCSPKSNKRSRFCCPPAAVVPAWPARSLSASMTDHRTELIDRESFFAFFFTPPPPCAVSLNAVEHSAPAILLNKDQASSCHECSVRLIAFLRHAVKRAAETTEWRLMMTMMTTTTAETQGE